METARRKVLQEEEVIRLQDNGFFIRNFIVRFWWGHFCIPIALLKSAAVVHMLLRSLNEKQVSTRTPQSTVDTSKHCKQKVDPRLRSWLEDVASTTIGPPKKNGARHVIGIFGAWQWQWKPQSCTIGHHKCHCSMTRRWRLRARYYELLFVKENNWVQKFS